VTAQPPGESVRGNDWTVLNGRRPDPPPRVSVIVVHYEQPAELARTLAALARQDHPHDLTEIVVADDGSARAPDVPEGVRLTSHAHVGARRGAARNLGVGASTGDVLVFLDADTAPEPGFITQLTRLPALAPEAVTVGRRRHADLSATAIEAPVEQTGPLHELPSPAWLRDAYAATGNLLRAGPTSFRFMISAVLGVSRWFFDEIGGFDESFTAYGGEDWEWAHRAWLSGAIFAHEPAAVAWHDGPEWAQRGAADRDQALRRKNDEAIRLSGLIEVAGHRPCGLRTRHPEAVIRLPSDIDPDSAFVTIDGLLAALPHAEVLVPEPILALCNGDRRVRVRPAHPGRRPGLDLDVSAPVRIDSERFRAVCRAIAEEDAGVWRLSDAAGVLLEIETSRHQLRRERWGASLALPSRDLDDQSVTRLPVPPDVEAYLGGWAR
jgi:GT2 family glycosyltransferase